MNRRRGRNKRIYTKVKGMNAKIVSTKGCIPNAKPKRIRREKEIVETKHIKVNLGNFLIALIIGLFAPCSFGVKLLLIIWIILMAFSEEEK